MQEYIKKIQELENAYHKIEKGSINESPNYDEYLEEIEKLV